MLVYIFVMRIIQHLKHSTELLDLHYKVIPIKLFNIKNYHHFEDDLK
jgi:hypothetical protein